jgi:hypothetical protein
VPTTRQRHLLTETDDLAAAIDAAAPLYPGESRAAFLLHLFEIGAEAIAERQSRRTCLVRERAGRYPGLYPTGHLDELRAEWPE